MSIFKAHLSQMGAYRPPLEGRSPQRHTLLDFNERTIPVSEHVVQALTDYIHSGSLQTYPHYGDITEQLANYCGVNPEQVMITNGSDQGIDLIIRASCSAGDEAIIPGPSFAMYTQCAKVENLHIIEPQYSRENGFPTQEVLAAITDKTRVIVISNPNNPSGTEVSREDILKIASAAPGCTVLVDECYFEYTRATVSDALEQHRNILVTRTFSKTWGLPSIRFGYVLSAAENISALLNIRGPYDVNQLALVAARAALDHPEYTHSYVSEVMNKSKPMLEGWLKERNITFWPSSANYLWIFFKNPEDINKELIKENILVRPKADRDGNPGLRITIGTLAQTEKLISCLNKFA
ncbi:histidinol-phosphate aminotransferase family protein [Sansalvadorimonas sp. 2012CJ34-2]|uniref:histidinol-phosphate transaminase n=1 Tax=Parendozoicomonas callyspongiae TaxID=2942213 RepID=A0ABT0PB51_9GAMM|nr:histidinol-phosphate transaminase [Sansalvadorimonas sp. 2012CJ34-2]MCL6268605.1 histidinol-phosphate aminotransferase family protein [Sansalvadorimonas sp. 2012CJ34-2]